MRRTRGETPRIPSSSRDRDAAQQMQNQQNKMAMIMMSMMSRNASGSVLNDCLLVVVVLNSATTEREVTAIPKSSIRLGLKII